MMEMHFAVVSFKKRFPQCVSRDIVECHNNIPIRIVELLNRVLIFAVPLADVPNSAPNMPTHQTTAIGLEILTKYPTSKGFLVIEMDVVSRSIWRPASLRL